MGNKIKNLSPGCLVLFFDKKTKEKPGIKTGCNQSGVLISENTILFCRKRKLVKINLSDLIGKKVEIFKIRDKEESTIVLKYFKKSETNYRLFKLGLRALYLNNMRIFSDPFIMPTLKKYKSHSEYKNAWNQLIPQIQKHDLIFTYNSKNITSKIISSIDNGSWSHCGIYRGNGQITEAITSGVSTRTIENYRYKNIHIGIYRSFNTEHGNYEIGDSFLEESIGNKYGYHKALILGIRTVLGFTENKYSPTDLTPNGLIYSGNLYLVDYL